MNPEQQLLNKLQSMDPLAFEELVGELWASAGYSVTVTPGSQDRGIDVVAEGHGSRILIQAKRYSGTTLVRSDEVQQYGALYRQEPDVDKVVIVTTSTFTKTAHRRAGELAVDCVNGSELVARLLDSTVDLDTYLPVMTFTSPRLIRSGERVEVLENSLALHGWLFLALVAFTGQALAGGLALAISSLVVPYSLLGDIQSLKSYTTASISRVAYPLILTSAVPPVAPLVIATYLSWRAYRFRPLIGSYNLDSDQFGVVSRD